MAEPEQKRLGLVEQLRQAIRDSGQSLNKLSQQSGVGRDRLSRFLRGERDLTLEAAEKVCRVLHMELSQSAVQQAEALALPEPAPVELVVKAEPEVKTDPEVKEKPKKKGKGK